MRAFHSVYRGLDNSHVGHIHTPIVIEIIHATVAVCIDDHVNRIAILMPALACSAAGIAEREVVRRRPETRQNFDVLSRYAMHLEVGEYKLELVQQLLTQNDVLGEWRAVVGNQVTQSEMIGYVDSRVLSRNLYEPRGVVVSVRVHSMQLARPEAKVVRADQPAALGVERNNADEGEGMPRHAAWNFIHSRWCASCGKQVHPHAATHSGARVASFRHWHGFERSRFPRSHWPYRSYRPRRHRTCRSVLRTMET